METKSIAITEAALVPADNVTNLPARRAVSTDIFSDPQKFEHAQRVAKVFAASDLVPPHMRNMANCLIALQIANRLNEDPLTVMQQIYIVSGRPGWATAYMVARANRSGVFSGPITWKSVGTGDKLSVTAKATIAATGEAIDVTCDMAMAQAEGWTRNSKYKSMGEHMLRWRSAAMLIRLYAPEVMLGMPVIEEVETYPEAMRDVSPAAPTREMKDALDAFAGSKPPMGNELDEFSGEGAAVEAEAGNTEAEKKAAAEADAKEKAETEAAAKKAAAAAKKEAARAKEAEAAKASTELDDTGEKESPKQEAGQSPKNAYQYTAMLKAHVDAATDGVALKAWFLSDEQKKLRGACSVTGDDMETCKNYTLAKIGGLASKAA